jgi:hypothetical protein
MTVRVGESDCDADAVERGRWRIDEVRWGGPTGGGADA